MTELRAGVIGVGWAGQQHIAGYAAAPDVRIAALAGQETDRIAALGERYAIPATFTRWEDMLDGVELDVLSIATPTFLHAPIAIAALERGIHVLTEKPIAATVHDAERMVEAARAAGRVLQVVFNHRLRGDIAELQRVIAAGEVGVPYVAKAGWLRSGGIPGNGWFSQKTTAGGGPLLDLGVHVIDYALHLLGEPEVLTVSAATHAELGPRLRGAEFDVEDIALAFLRLEGGTTLTIEASWDAHRADNNEYWMTVYGTEGGAELRVVDYTTSEFSVFREVDGVRSVQPMRAGPDGGHSEVVRQFVDVVRAGEQEWPRHDGSLGLKRARVIDACYRSATKQCEVTLA